MHWNAYLADAIGWVILIIPFALVALKMGYPGIRWWMILLAALILGWCTSVGYFWAFPPDMGFVAALAPLFGWATMLPLLGVLSVAWVVKRWRGARTARFAGTLLVLIALALPITACFRWISEEEAKEIATKELKRCGFTEFRIGNLRRTWDGWSIDAEVPSYASCRIDLSRSGLCYSMERHQR